MIPTEIEDIALRARRGEAVSATVRTILGWFKEPRRSAAAIERMVATFTRSGLATQPSIADAWIDEPIAFESVAVASLPTSAALAPSPIESLSASDTLATSAVPVLPLPARWTEPKNRVGAIAAAHRPLVSVPPDATLADALSVLRLDGLSCVTVASPPGHTALGVVTWRSLAVALESRPIATRVREIAERAQVFTLEADVFDVARAVRREGHVLVKHGDGRLRGPITAQDFLEEFGTRLEPFLLVGELEAAVRDVVESRLPEIVRQYRESRGSAAAGLTIGDSLSILQSEENYRASGLQFTRAQFNHRLDKLRELRNDLVHFNRGEVVGPEEVERLRNFVRALRESVPSKS